ncbi:MULTISPECIES: flagellar hook protein FlgE [unclassified Paracoccus (in: a-proteobacteria)]|uniref:flagellar hook protein FlgE n=1 Tax=unclassified Paracoccus (in: a-proteobacteria) TaxID=2688777 RepID=UPI0012B234AB|nr:MULTISPECIES: flagellar hook-basal body complex protein [unclassified Paracoccus (in: a-proteobacteria)]UXU75843.1 flagellar hook-basal body complex protein [Paracoccus sp. SMMA_5]UXU81752.1 flagellar hook-basal body complex protein [Paracoccus sp. SMMA_5_TC]
MSISSALNASVLGLSANSTRLSGISDNIANSGTYGYKRVTTAFESLVINEGRGGSYTAGGVRALSERNIDQRGNIVGTAHPLDIAISGRGMLPVTDTAAAMAGTGNRSLMMTTTGAFRLDDEGFLRTSSGLVLMGWPAAADGTVPAQPRDSATGLQAIRINSSQKSADPTTRINLGLNLPANDAIGGAAGDAREVEVEYFSNLGGSERMRFTLTPDVSGPAGTRTNSWTVEIRDSAIVDDAGTAADESLIGTFTLTFRDTQPGAGTLSAVTAVTGGAYDPVSGAVTVTGANGPMAINVGRYGDANGITQLAAGFSSANVTKNGSPVGNLTGLEVDEHGYLKATYDTGFSRTLYQIPLVDVPNPNGLIANDNQTYRISSESGPFYLWNAGDGPTGSMVGYAREASTTDVAAELTDLIQTQRAYTSNAKVIQTVDEMLQETANLKR